MVEIKFYMQSPYHITGICSLYFHSFLLRWHDYPLTFRFVHKKMGKENILINEKTGSRKIEVPIHIYKLYHLTIYEIL